MIWSLAPLGILAVLVAIDWAARRHAGRPWIEPACGCLHPNPENTDPRFASRCRNCGLLWDVFSGQPLDQPRKDPR